MEVIADRKIIYALKYKKQIECLTSLDESIINKNNFLVSMKHVLLTGDRKFTKNMEIALDKVMSNPIYNKKYREKQLIKFKSIFEKMNKLKILIKSIDTEENIIAGRSSYNFVTSVEWYLKNRLSVSKKQLLALNRIYDKYIKKSKLLDDVANIPF